MSYENKPTPFAMNELVQMAQLAEGQPAAKQWLYDRYAGAVYGVILQAGIDTLVARQVLAQTFDIVFAALAHKKMPNPKHALPLLLQTARRLCPAGNDPTKGEVSLQQFTNTLETPIKAVFHLCYARNLPHEHAAATLNLSLPEIQSLLTTGMIAFRKYLQSQ